VAAVDILLSLLQVSLWLSGSIVATLCTMHDAQAGSGLSINHGHRRWCESCVLSFNVCEYLDLGSLLLFCGVKLLISR
jgi:hypothetical protein